MIVVDKKEWKMKVISLKFPLYDGPSAGWMKGMKNEGYKSKSLLLTSGDIHPNPGPEIELRIAHVNARSLKNKIELFEAESNQFDIITVSETWLSPSVSDSTIYSNNFHPPVRVD